MQKTTFAFTGLVMAAAIALSGISSAHEPGLQGKPTPASPHVQSFRQGQSMSRDARAYAKQNNWMYSGAQHVYASHAYARAAGQASTMVDIRKAQKAAGYAQMNAGRAYQRAGDPWAASTSFRNAQKHFTYGGRPTMAAAAGAASEKQVTRALMSGRTAQPR